MKYIIEIPDDNDQDEYKKGCKDGWNLAKLISSMPDSQIERIFGIHPWEWENPVIGVLRMYNYDTARTCLSKHKVKADELKVGDEVRRETDGAVFVVIAFEKENGENYCRGFGVDGYLYRANEKTLKKTGRTFQEIAELLKKMREPDADNE